MRGPDVHCIGMLIFAMVTVPITVRAQCPTVCGDYNQSGAVTSADIFSLTAWQYQGMQAPDVDSACWDIDGYDVITNRDLVWLTRHVVDSSPILNCDTLQPALTILPTIEFYFAHETVFLAYDSIARLNIDIVHRQPLAGASIAFEVQVDGQVAVLDTEDGSMPYPVGFAGKGHLDGWKPAFGGDGGLFGFATWLTTLPPGRRPFLRTIDVHMPPAPYDRRMEVVLVSVDSIIVDPSVDRSSQIVDSNHNIWAIQVGPSDCPYVIAGDSDFSGTVPSSDITLLVNYVFKNGAPPLPCAPADDVNCDLVVNSADVISLVNHVFKGSGALCDPCMAWLEPWGCL
jgi:hypothetical protein